MWLILACFPTFIHAAQIRSNEPTSLTSKPTVDTTTDARGGRWAPLGAPTILAPGHEAGLLIVR